MSRQTVSYLQRRFREIGLSPDSRHGQNFLVDLNLVKLLVNTAELTRDDVVLEVGTGTGSMTAMIAQEAGTVVTVEIDEHLFQMAREELAEFDNVVMLHQDALRNKNNFHANVIATVREKLGEGTSRHFKLVANLPYNIATPVVSNLLGSEIVPDSMTVTIQKELADRIVARPRTKDYGALSIWIQSLCDAEIVRIMQPSVFWPRPKVESAIVHIVHRPDLRDRIVDIEFFHSFVRSMFFHRRKFLRRELLSAFKGKLDKPAVDAIMAKMGLAADSRAEQLSVEQMLGLCDLVRESVGSLP